MSPIDANEANASSTDLFETYRPLMFSIAYRMLGSATDAEDIVQEAFLRCQGVDYESIRAPKAFFGTVVTRLSLNQLTSARAKRERYIGPWIPEPVMTEDGDAVVLSTVLPSPSQQAELHDSVSLAFLMLLERLSPVERSVFLLREVFGYDYAEIAHILEQEETNCRQLLGRAKKHLADQRPRFRAPPAQHRRLLSQFIETVSAGDVTGLIELLNEDVRMWADGGGKTRGAALHPLDGAKAVASFVIASTRYLPAAARFELAMVNGQITALIRDKEQAVLVIAIEAQDNRISEIRVIGNPDKLTHLSSSRSNQQVDSK